MTKDIEWVDIIIKAMRKLGGSAEYTDLYGMIENLYSLRLKTKPTWDATVRYTIGQYSSDSKHFGGKKDIFYSVEGMGNGIWGLRNFDSDITPTPDAVDLDLGDDKQDLPNRKSIHVYRIIRDSKISRWVKELYEYKCQLRSCLYSIQLPTGEKYAEAHHIQPLSHEGPDIKQNILCLCPNHHVELDYGVRELRREDLFIHEHHSLDDRFIEYHNNEILQEINGS